MAPIRESEDWNLHAYSLPMRPTFSLTRPPERSLLAIKDDVQEAPPLERVDGQPGQSSRWEDYKPIMRRLYIDEGRPLRELIEIMKSQFGFDATAKMYKTRLRAWGWRKYIRLGPGTDTGIVQDVISIRHPEDDGGPPAQKVLLANGQLVDLGRLQQHLRRKRRQRENPLGIRIAQPDAFHLSEAIFYSARSHTVSRYQGRLHGVKDALDIFAGDEPAIGRWLRFTDEIQDLMKKQNLAGAIVKMRRAPDEVAAMIESEPTVLLSNLFMYILKVGNYAAVNHTESRHVKLVVKSLLQYTASLLASGSSGTQTSRPLQTIVNGLATAPESDLGEIASRSWLVILQSCAEVSGLDPSAAVSEGSLVKWLQTGDQGEKDGLWFLEIIQGIIDGTVAKLEAVFGKNDFRCLEGLQRKADLIMYANIARRRPFQLDPRLEEMYLQILERGAQGEQRADALRFLAEIHRARGELGIGEDYSRLRLAPVDN